MVVSGTENDDLIVNETKKNESSIGSLNEIKINAVPTNTTFVDYVKQHWEGNVIVTPFVQK